MKTTQTTVQMVRNGNANLPNPIYKSKPYVVIASKGNVLCAGTLESIAALPDYYNDEAVMVREHDLDSNDNTKLPTTITISISEHAALVAVAEAVKAERRLQAKSKDQNFKFTDMHVAALIDADDAVTKALAQLAAVRGGK